MGSVLVLASLGKLLCCEESNMNRDFNRRDFLKRTAVTAGAAAAWSLRGAPTILAADSPNEKLGVAVIGAGGMGGYSMDCGLRENLVAIARCGREDDRPRR